MKRITKYITDAFSGADSSEPAEEGSSLMAKFKGDARISLRIAFVICTLLATFSALLVYFHGERDHRMKDTVYETHSEKLLLFQYFVYFSLAISLPVVIDMFMTYFFTNTTYEEISQPRDFSRRYMMLVVTFPNLLIATEFIPATSVDIVMYYQFTLTYLAIVYRIYTLCTPQKIVCFCSLRELYFLLMISVFAGFLYDLSLHNIIGGKLALKTIFSIFMVLSQCVAVVKITKWLKFLNRISEVSNKANKSVQASKGTLYALVFAVFVCICMIIIYLVYYEQDVLFFPDHFESYYALEAIFCFTLLTWTAVRNFEATKSEVATKVSQPYNSFL